MWWELIRDKGQIILIDDHESISFTSFKAAVINRSREFKEQNLPSVIAIKTEQNISYWIDFFALIHLNKIVHPFTDSEPDDEWIQTIISNQTIIHKSKSVHHQIKEYAKKNEAGLILKTSATTGKPKAILHSFHEILLKYQKLKNSYSTLLVFSSEHISGIETFLSIIVPGGTIIISSNRSISNLTNIIEKYQLTLLACTPSFIRLCILGNVLKKLKSVQILNLGGEKSNIQLIQNIHQILPDIKIFQAYGTTETSNIRTYNQPNDLSIQLGQIDVDYKIIDQVLWLKKTKSIICFLENQEHEPTDWFCTNDIVQTLPNGNFIIIGRKEKMINVGGEKINPNEIENVLMTMKGIHFARVYAENDPIIGNRLIAELVIDYKFNLTKKMINEFCRLSLPDYKIPVKYHFKNSIEVTNRLKNI